MVHPHSESCIWFWSLHAKGYHKTRKSIEDGNKKDQKRKEVSMQGLKRDMTKVYKITNDVDKVNRVVLLPSLIIPEQGDIQCNY